MSQNRFIFAGLMADDREASIMQRTLTEYLNSLSVRGLGMRFASNLLDYHTSSLEHDRDYNLLAELGTRVFVAVAEPSSFSIMNDQRLRSRDWTLAFSITNTMYTSIGFKTNEHDRLNYVTFGNAAFRPVADNLWSTDPTISTKPVPFRSGVITDNRKRS